MSRRFSQTSTLFLGVFWRYPGRKHQVDHSVGGEKGEIMQENPWGGHSCLPPTVGVVSGCLWPALIFRSVSGLHSYPGIRGSCGRIGHPRRYSRVLLFGIISRSRVSWSIASAIVVTIARGGICIRLRVHVRRRHNGLVGTRVGNLGRGVRSCT